MQYQVLFKQFKELVKSPSSLEGYDVLSIPKTDHKLSASKEGYPTFFICTDDTSSSAQNTTLNILSVEYNISCTFINNDGKQEQKHYTLITLCSKENKLQEDFIDIIVMMMQKLPPTPSKREISVEVENLISIFSAMSLPPKKKIQGLWTELLVIEQSEVIEPIIKAWHTSPDAKYDFTLGRDKVEVKSTSKENRVHHFSLDQLSPSTNSRVVIASSIVRESGPSNDGLSIRGLYDKICNRTESAEARLRVIKIIVETIGSDLNKSDDYYFDYTEACDTLRFYNAEDIPRVNKSEIDPGVSKIGFDSDLTGVVDLQSPKSTFDRGNSLLFNSLYK
jgi:hypothetical protein